MLVSVFATPARAHTVKESDQPILSDLDVVARDTSCVLRDAFYATVSVAERL